MLHISSLRYNAINFDIQESEQPQLNSPLNSIIKMYTMINKVQGFRIKQNIHAS